MKYLVIGSGGLGFAPPEEAVSVLEAIVLPGFDKLIGLEKKKIVAGGLPVGDRAFVFIAEAASGTSSVGSFRLGSHRPSDICRKGRSGTEHSQEAQEMTTICDS